MDFKYKIADVAKEFGMPAKKVVETVSGVTGEAYKTVGTFDIPDTNPVHKLLRPDFGNRFSGKSPVGHHYRKSFCREVE